MVFPGLSPKDSWAKQQQCACGGWHPWVQRAGQHGVKADTAFPGSLHPSREESTAGRRKKIPVVIPQILFTELVHMADEMICLQAHRKSNVRQDLFGNPVS